MALPTLLDRLTLDAAQLVAEHSPVLADENKKLLFDLIKESTPRGTFEYTRWRALDLPGEIIGGSVEVVAKPGVYEYGPAHPGELAWHVNFADPSLFVAYGTSLMAQDEAQVAEHPALMSVREMLRATGKPAQTVDEDGTPTPVLIRGVERRLALHLEPDASKDRPDGLYGNRFASAAEAMIRDAAEVLDPPTISNVIAMAALSAGEGAYTADEVAFTLGTAYAAFYAALLETLRHSGEDAGCVIHTGFWGCGAFGGNRVMMALLQLIAGAIAGVDRIVFYTFDREGEADLARAQGYLELFDLGGQKSVHTRKLVDAIVGLGLKWGVSDGN